MHYYVYFLTGANNKVLYIGRTQDLLKRISQHRQKLVQGFSARYHLNKLVYFETYDKPLAAAEREYKLKRWRREWKNSLISQMNVEWRDLYPVLSGEIPDSLSASGMCAENDAQSHAGRAAMNNIRQIITTSRTRSDPGSKRINE